MENYLENNDTLSNNYMENIPSKRIRRLAWGIFLSLCAVLLLASIVQYPDTEIVSVTLTTNMQREHLVARAAGNIHFLQWEGAEVEPNTPIAIVENTADYEDVVSVDSIVKSQLKILDTALVDSTNLKITYRLGEIQEYFLAFYNARKNLEMVVYDRVAVKAIEGLKQQQQIAHDLLDISNKQLGIEQSITQAQSELHQNAQNSYYEEAATKEEYLQEKLRFLSQLRNEQSASLNTKNIVEQISSINTTLGKEELDFEKKILFYRYEFVSSAYQLLSMVEEWKARYLLTSNIEGNVIFLTGWRDNQFVSAGDEVATIIPHDEEYFCYGFVQPKSLSKIEKGQKVNINFDGYTTFEYGTVLGNLDYINIINKDSIVRVFISLPDGLITSHKETINFVHELRGMGQIITKEKSILYRLFEKTAKAFEKKK
ncbi:MAG: HlyD family efflux transporter periplasmic adaptor subunit [Bacteroidales bacterium]|jgi:hypothetical protein|nr:HlyD family efflux transporter periplasmic adaptor subunit [Bacteroidales bacterium]